jgi:hypothetical protein
MDKMGQDVRILMSSEFKVSTLEGSAPSTYPVLRVLSLPSLKLFSLEKTTGH